jgi:hypothetical protein
MEIFTHPVMKWVAGEPLPTPMNGRSITMEQAKAVISGYVEYITFYDSDGHNGIQFLMHDNGANEMLPVNDAFSIWFAEHYPFRARGKCQPFYGDIIILTGEALWD